MSDVLHSYLDHDSGEGTSTDPVPGPSPHTVPAAGISSPHPLQATMPNTLIATSQLGKPPQGPSVPNKNDENSTPVQNINIGTMANVMGQMGHALPQNIFHGAVFHGTVNINFNITK